MHLNPFQPVGMGTTTVLFLAVAAFAALVGLGIDEWQKHFPLTPHWMIFIAHCFEYFIYVGDLWSLVRGFVKHLK